MSTGTWKPFSSDVATAIEEEGITLVSGFWQDAEDETVRVFIRGRVGAVDLVHLGAYNPAAVSPATNRKGLVSGPLARAIRRVATARS